MRIYIPFVQFLMLAITTALLTYFFNEALFAGRYVLVIFWGLFLLRNLHASYHLGLFMRYIDDQTKKGH